MKKIHILELHGHPEPLVVGATVQLRLDGSLLVGRVDHVHRSQEGRVVGVVTLVSPVVLSDSSVYPDGARGVLLVDGAESEVTVGVANPLVVEDTVPVGTKPVTVLAATARRVVPVPSARVPHTPGIGPASGR